jgi:hypothetical protein
MWAWIKPRWVCRVVSHHETPADCLGRIRCLRCGAKRYHIAMLNGAVLETRWADDDSAPIRSTREPTASDHLILVGMRLAEAGMPLAWLYAQHDQLDGMSPADACKAGRTDQVFSLIEQWTEYQEHHDV